MFRDFLNSNKFNDTKRKCKGTGVTVTITKLSVLHSGYFIVKLEVTHYGN